MKITRKTILSASAISAFSLTLAVGLSANVDQTSQQQGAPLQGSHPPTQYGTPGERASGAHRPGVGDLPSEELQQAEGRFQQQRATQEERDRVQAQQPPARQQQQQQQLQQPDQLARQTEEHRATDLLEKRVENQQGDRLGSIEDLIIDVNSGELEFVVVSAGGILGMGGDLRAVPPEALQVSDQDRVLLDISRDRWEQAPTIDRNEIAQLGQEQRAREIYTFYGRDYTARGAQQFGAREQRETGSELRQEDMQQRQPRHRTAEPHRLPGDPYGSPAEPQPLPQDRSEVQDEFQRQGQLQQQQTEFGARDRMETRQPEAAVDASPGTEWRMEAFDEEVSQLEQRRQQQGIQYGAPDRRETVIQQDREMVGADFRAERGAPALNNPRLAHTHRGTEEKSQQGALEMERTYGQPHYRQESTEQQQWGATPREREWRQRSTQQESATEMRGQRTEQRQKTQQVESRQASLKMASDMLGSKVAGQQQEELGEISDFLVDLENGRVTHTIVQLDKKETEQFAVPVHQLQVNEQQDQVTVRADRQQLQQAPRYDQRAAAQQRDQIFRYEQQRETRREFGAPLREDETQEGVREPEADLPTEEAITEPDQPKTTREFGAREAKPAAEESPDAEAQESPDVEAQEDSEGEAEQTQ